VDAMGDTVHNIISGTVTNRRDHIPASVTAKRVAKRIMIIVGVVLGVMIAFGLIVNGVRGELTGPSKSLPACEFEDGSTQAQCTFKGSDGRTYVNHNYGEWWEVHP
jgi:hypothetical protein